MIPFTVFNSEPEGCDLPTILHRIIYQVVKNPDNQRIGKHFRSDWDVVVHHELSGLGLLCHSIYKYPAILSGGSMDTDLLIFHDEPDHVRIEYFTDGYPSSSSLLS